MNKYPQFTDFRWITVDISDFTTWRFKYNTIKVMSKYRVRKWW